MKQRQIVLRRFDDAQRIASGIHSVAGQDVYRVDYGTIPAPSGMSHSFDQAYLLTDAPMPVVRKAAKMHSVEIPIQPRKNPSASFDAGTLPSVRRGVKSPTVYMLVSSDYGARTVFYTRADVVRAIQRKPDGSYIYLSQLGLRRPLGAWVKSGSMLIHFPEGMTPVDISDMATTSNPALTIVRNPRRSRSRDGQILTNRVLAIQYIHGADGKAYEHKFKRGVTVEFLPDGTARLYRKDGRPLWKNVV